MKNVSQQDVAKQERSLNMMMDEICSTTMVARLHKRKVYGSGL
jgi:hypothetical protein